MSVYVTIADVRNEGVPASILDATIQMWLNFIEAFIEDTTEQYFNPRTGQLLLDGSGSDTLFLSIPIISVSALYVNIKPTEDISLSLLNPSTYMVYARRTKPTDDRKNPRIKLIGTGSLFDPPWTVTGPQFMMGSQNQRVDGTFGFVDDDGLGGYKTPDAIKYAVRKLAIRKMAENKRGMWTAMLMPTAPPPGARVQETTDGHSVTYGTALRNLKRVGWQRFTQDPEIDEIIMMYKRPIAVRATGSTVLMPSR